jgi:hypothetical protein
MSSALFIAVDTGSIKRVEILVNISNIETIESFYNSGHADSKPAGSVIIYQSGRHVRCNESLVDLSKLIYEANKSAQEWRP